MTLFDRVVPNSSDSEEVSFAHRNLLPRLQLHIPRQNFSTFFHLEQLSVAAVKSIRVAKLFRPSPVPERSLLPDLAYKDKPRNRDRQRELISQLEESNFDNKNPAENSMDKFFLAKENTPYLQNPQLSQKNNTNETSNISRNNNPKYSNQTDSNSNNQTRNTSRNPFLSYSDSQKNPSFLLKKLFVGIVIKEVTDSVILQNLKICSVINV